MNNKTNLFCLPFAGGNKYSYRLLSDNAPAFLNLITLEYPGRGTRVKEQLINNIDPLVNDLYLQVKDKLDIKKYAIYGHSMGGLIAYLLTLKIIKNNHNPPEHLFITGTTGPSAISRLEKQRYLLPKNEFINEIKELGGMPDEILQSKELLDYVEPILRSDFETVETYKYQEHAPLDVPFTVITGTHEDMTTEDISLWQKETSLPVDFKTLPGKHFFILQHTDHILKVIAKKLSNSISRNYEQASLS